MIKILSNGTPVLTSPPSSVTTPSDILLWLEYYTTMAAILVSQYPTKPAELLAYQHTILRTHRDFKGTAWVTFETCYCRQAAAKKFLDWSQMDLNLYNQTFAGRAKAKSRCRYCLSEYHQAEDCYYAPEPTQHHTCKGNLIPLISYSGSLPQFAHYGAHALRLRRDHRTNLLKSVSCSTMKKGTCRFKKCKYMHLCSNKGCHG